MNKLQEAIAKLKADEQRSELNERLLQMLLEKQRELGDNISEEEAEKAASDVFKEHLMEALRSVVPHVEEAEEEENWDDTMEDAKDVVHGYFRDKKWKYRDYVHQKGVHAFELGIRENGKRILVSGCSHKGILDIAAWFSPDVLVGGFHVSKMPPDDTLAHVAHQLGQQKTTYYTCHCTGEEQYVFMKKHMKDLHYLSCGQSITL